MKIKDLRKFIVKAKPDDEFILNSSTMTWHLVRNYKSIKTKVSVRAAFNVETKLFEGF